LAQKYAPIFVRGYYLFWESNSLLKAEFEKNCELQEKVSEQISKHVFFFFLLFWRLLYLSNARGISLRKSLGYFPVLVGISSITRHVQTSKRQKSAIMAKSENSKIWIVTYNSSIIPILQFLHDSPIFTIVRLYHLLFSDSTWFSDFSDYTILLHKQFIVL